MLYKIPTKLRTNASSWLAKVRGLLTTTAPPNPIARQSPTPERAFSCPLPHVPEQKAGGLQRDRTRTELQLVEFLFTEVLCSHIGRCFPPVSDEISRVSHATMLYKRSAFEVSMRQKVVTERVSDDIYSAIAAKASAEGVSLSAIAARLLSDALKSGSESPDKPARSTGQWQSEGQAPIVPTSPTPLIRLKQKLISQLDVLYLMFC